MPAAMKQVYPIPSSQEKTRAIDQFTEWAIHASVGVTLTYAELEQLTGHPYRLVQMWLARVNKRLLPYKRLLVNVRTVGYRVAPAEAHLAHAHHRRRKGNRQFRWSLAEYQGLDVSRLTPEQTHVAETAIAHLETIVAFARKRTTAGIHASERAITHQQAVADELATMATQLVALRARLQS